MTNVFDFTGFDYDEASGVLSLHYRVKPSYEFTEKITFEGARQALTPAKKRVLNQIFKYLHIAAGTSYYKAFLCPSVTFNSYTLTQYEADFFNKFYISGLGEFSYRNNVMVPSLFTASPDSCSFSPEEIDLPNKCLIAVGGGKDSSVTTELMRAENADCTLFAMGNHRAILETIQAAGLPHISVKRELSPVLLDLNKQGKVLNGHVPVTGILSFILLAAAVIYDFKYVVMSNERSASFGNTSKNGLQVNHQWSKSLEFENMLIDLLANNITPSVKYFSRLRPYSELTIAEKFASFPKYHDVFTSCNHAFKYVKENRTDRWCAACDKCRFVYLILSPFMDRNRLSQIFGDDLLNNPANEKGYEELLGLSGFKPFECVGEITESVAALFMLSDKKQWSDSYIVRKLLPRVIEKYSEKTCESFIKEAFTDSKSHNIPKEFTDADF